MAFVSYSELPPDPRVNKQYKVRHNISNMSGTFEVGTILTCIKVHKKSMEFSDGLGHYLLLNFISVLEELDLVE